LPTTIILSTQAIAEVLPNSKEVAGYQQKMMDDSFEEMSKGMTSEMKTKLKIQREEAKKKFNEI